MTPPELKLRLAGPFPSNAVDRLITKLGPLDNITNPTRVVVDLASLGRISAASAAVLVCALREIEARGLIVEGSEIRAPTRPEVARHLQALEVLESIARVSSPSEEAPKREQGSLPCQLFSRADDPAWVATRLAEAIAEVCETDTIAQNAIWYALHEIAQNVVDHSESRGGAVGIAEVSAGSKELEVAVADHGIGIRASLSANPDYRELGSDLAALKTAIQPGVTARIERPGGFGLFIAHVILRENGGSLIIRSGTGQLEAGATSVENFDLARLQGTLITLRFRTDRRFSLEPIFSAVESRAAASP